MSQDIINEVYFLAGSICMGVMITFVYDFILIARRVIRHSLFVVSLEDLLFWLTCAIVVFYMLYEENNGILRWFAVMGAAIGMLLYKKTVGVHFVKLISSLIKKEIHIICKILGFVFKPFRCACKYVEKSGNLLLRRGKKIVKYIKKKLTGLLKVLKISLCKH